MAAEEFLKLFKFSNDIAQRIARGFFDTTILSCYNNSLSIFLDKNKHTIYHLWSNKVRCCDCVSNPITLLPNQILYKTQFEKMFTITGNYTRGHFIQGRKNCLCAITLNAGCTLDNLDITIIAVLTRNCGSLSPNDVSKFVGVADIRNTVTHAPNLEFFKSDELETLWNQLESYVMELTNNCPFKYLYKNVKEEIRALRNTLLTNEEETELVDTIKEENENLANSLLQQIKDTRSRLREKSDEIKQHSKKFDKILEDFSKLLVGINNLTFNVDLQHIASQTDKSTSDTKAKDDRINKSWIGCALLILVCGVAMGLINQDLSNQIGAFTVGVGACLLILLIIPWKSQNAVRLEDEICEVRWFFTTPSQWDPKDMKKKLEEMASHHNLPFKIRFIYVGSLVIHTTITKSILNDKGVLNTAIESFLKQMVEICEIDTSIKQTVAVDLLFTESSYSERSTSAVGKVDIGEERVVCPNCSHLFKLQDDRGNPPKDAEHIHDVMKCIEEYPHPNVTGAVSPSGTLPLRHGDVWNRMTDWYQLSDAQQTSNKAFLLERFSADDLELAYDEFYLRFGRQPTVHDYRVFILNWEGRRDKTPSLDEVNKKHTSLDEEKVDSENKFKVITEETNFLRLYLLSMNIGPEAVRNVFDRHVPPADLDNHLRKFEIDLRGTHRSMMRCFPAQLKVLFPAKPLLPQSKDFDFSLLYKLIRCTLSIPAPAQGWGNEPLTNDISEADDIERVRTFRSYLVHNDKCKLTEDIFKQKWSELSQAILRLSGGTLAEEIKALEQKSLVSSM